MAPIKVAVVGPGGVGKSCLTIQYIHAKFVDSYDPTIEDSYKKDVLIGHKTYPLEIVDTAGQEEFATMRETYMKEAQGFMLVYSVVDEATVDQLAEFFTQILRVHEDKAVIPLVVVGNKSDLDPKKVSVAEAEAKCRKFLSAAGGEKHTFKVLEASAKTKANVTEAFELLVQKCVEATEGKSGGGGGDAKGKKKGCELL